MRTRGLSGSTLKIIAITAMLIDHIGAVVLESWMHRPRSMALYYTLYHYDLLLRGIGRLGFPLFAFLLTEGYVHTSNRWKYARNLFVFALLSEIPFDLAFQHCLYAGWSQNVFFTLLIALLTIMAIDHFAFHSKWPDACSWLFYPCAILLSADLAWQLINGIGLALLVPAAALWIAGGILCIILIFSGTHRTPQERNTFTFCVLPLLLGIAAGDLLQTDYSGLGVFTITLIWLLRNEPAAAMAAGCTLLSAGNAYEIPTLLTIPLVRSYNGSRGLRIKYLFYLFYPCHLLILYGIAYFLGFAGFALTG